MRAIPTSPRSFPPPTGCSARRSISSASRPTPTISGRGCGMASWPIDRFPLRRDFGRTPKWEPGQEEYPFVRVRATACTRSPSVPCTRASSSPGISASRSSARRYCGSRSGSATCTKASRSASRRCRSPTASPRRSRVRRQHRRLRVGVRAGGRSDRGTARSAARRVAARARARARAHRQPSGRPGLPRQRRRLRFRPRAVLAAQGGRAARQSRRRSATGC